MKINEVLSLACSFLGLNDLQEKLQGKIEQESDERLISLLKCLNIAYSEVFTNYIPSFQTEEVVTKSGEIAFSLFSNKVGGVVSVKDECGKKLKFTLSSNKIITSQDKVYVTYIIKPNSLNFNGEVDLMLPDNILAYGTAREYLLMEGLSDEAIVYEERFKQTISAYIRRGSTHILPKRLWL